jgi:hypothetical protein
VQFVDHSVAPSMQQIVLVPEHARESEADALHNLKQALVVSG